MGSVEIYYFSGTGNSLAVARDIAERLNGRVKPAAPLLDREKVVIEADIIGFVFPVYDFKPPRVIEDFVGKLEGIEKSYLFAVCTYGLSPAKSLEYVDSLLKTRGACLSAGFAVGMPHNGIGSRAIPGSVSEGMFKNWKQSLGEVCKYIENGEKGRIYSSSLFFLLFKSRFYRMLPSLLKFLLQVLLKGIESLAYTAGENCTGCSICERVCPVNNIEMVSDRPVWGDRCAGCFACLQWCPEGAVSLGGVDMNISNYHHPEVKLVDMIKECRNNSHLNVLKEKEI